MLKRKATDDVGQTKLAKRAKKSNSSYESKSEYVFDDVIEPPSNPDNASSSTSSQAQALLTNETKTDVTFEIDLNPSQWSQVFLKIINCMENYDKIQFAQQLERCTKQLIETKGAKGKIHAKFQKIMGHSHGALVEQMPLFSILKNTQFDLLEMLIKSDIKVAHALSTKQNYSRKTLIENILENIFLSPLPLDKIIAFLDYIKIEDFRLEKGSQEYKEVFDDCFDSPRTFLCKLLIIFNHCTFPIVDKISWLANHRILDFNGIVKTLIQESNPNLPKLELFFSKKRKRGLELFSILVEHDPHKNELFALALRKGNKECLTYFIQKQIEPKKWTLAIAASLGLMDKYVEIYYELCETNPNELQNSSAAALQVMVRTYEERCLNNGGWQNLFYRVLTEQPQWFAAMNFEDQCEVIEGCRFFVEKPLLIDPSPGSSNNNLNPNETLGLAIKRIRVLFDIFFKDIKWFAIDRVSEAQLKKFSDIIALIKFIMCRELDNNESYCESIHLLRPIKEFLKGVDSTQAVYVSYWTELLMLEVPNQKIRTVSTNLLILDYLKDLKWDYSFAIRKIVENKNVSLEMLHQQLENIAEVKEICDLISNKNVLSSCMHELIKKYLNNDKNNDINVHLRGILQSLKKLGADFNWRSAGDTLLFTYLKNAKSANPDDQEHVIEILRFLLTVVNYNLEIQLSWQNNFICRVNIFGYIALINETYSQGDANIYANIEQMLLENNNYNALMQQGRTTIQLQLFAYQRQQRQQRYALLPQPIPLGPGQRINAVHPYPIVNRNAPIAHTINLPKLHQDKQSTHTIAIHKQTAEAGKKLKEKYIPYENNIETYWSKIITYYHEICFHYKNLVLNDAKIILEKEHPQQAYADQNFRNNEIKRLLASVENDIDKGYNYSQSCPFIPQLWSTDSFIALRWLKATMGNQKYAHWQEPLSGISILECLVSIWLAIKDRELCTNDEPSMMRHLTKIMAKIQREYNKDDVDKDFKKEEKKKDEKNGKDEKANVKIVKEEKDAISCPGGAFNLLISVLEGQHKFLPPMVQISSGHLLQFIIDFYEEKFKTLTSSEKEKHFAAMFNHSDLMQAELPHLFVHEFKNNFYQMHSDSIKQGFITSKDIDAYFATEGLFVLERFKSILEYINQNSSSNSKSQSSNSFIPLAQNPHALFTPPPPVQADNAVNGNAPMVIDASTVTIKTASNSQNQTK